MRRRQRSGVVVRWIVIGILILAISLLGFEIIVFSRSNVNLPDGLTIAGIPVGNLSRQEAAERVRYIYSLPVELYYGDAVIQMNPSLVNFDLDLESMMAQADLQRANSGNFWGAFWSFLWGRQITPTPVPLAATYSENLLESYLQNEISPRYDVAPVAPQPIVGTSDFKPGIEGTTIDIPRAVLLVEDALYSNDDRFVHLPLTSISSDRPTFDNLEILLKQTIQVSGFEGLAGVYFLDLQTSNEIHFLLDNGEEINPEPDIAISGASMMKIPIMTSIYRVLDETNIDAETFRWLDEMITLSGNDPSDWLAQRYLEPNLGPLVVTEDMQNLGLESTFWSRYFYFNSPPLRRYETPANSRPDYSTDPDDFNQTTITEMGSLLADIYLCAEYGGGGLMAVWPDDYTPGKCQQMIDLLAQNKTGNLIEIGVPEGTKVAHKHGWVSDGGITYLMSDAAIVYTPAADYVLVIFFYHPVQAIYDPINETFRSLSALVYNFYNSK